MHLEHLLSSRYSRPDVRGQRILCLGLGGGADAVTACLWAEQLTQAGAEAHYGNTKRDLSGELVPLSAHLFALGGAPQPLAGSDSGIRIDASLPRGAGDSPLILHLPRRVSPVLLAAASQALRARGYDRVVGIDNGGDVLCRRGRAGSRDFQALQVLWGTGLPCEVVVFGLCSDGTAPGRVTDQLRRFDRTTYRGAVPLAPLRARLGALGAGLRQSRTVPLLCSALDHPDDPIRIPRGAAPTVPRDWLCHAFVFDAAPFFDTARPAVAP